MSSADDMDNPDQAIDTVLRRGLHTEPLSADALDRIRTATGLEWQAAVRGARPHRYRRRYMAAAAATILLALVAGWAGMNRGAARAFAAGTATLERADYPGALERHRWSRDRLVSSGERLVEGQDLLIRGGARIALVGEGSLRVAAGSRLQVLPGRMIRLVDGSIYVDVPPASAQSMRLVIQTPAGTFTHLGTQFQVAVYNGETQVRVREGQVNWHSAAGDSVAGAGVELLIDKRGKVSRIQVETTGSAWRWAEVLAAPFEIENRPLADFLQHAARETGRKLEYGSPATERQAAAAILHGSIDKLTTVEALSAVMATTSLRFALNGDSIRIESEGDSKKIR